jgi:hypothetical protein
MENQSSDFNRADIASRLLAIEEKEKQFSAIERKRKSQVLISATIVLIGSVLGMTASLVASFSSDLSRSGLRITLPDSTSSEAKFDRLEARLRTLEASVNKTKAFSQNVPGQVPVKIAADVESLNNRMNSLSMAILASPERAIAIPLLRRDIDGISKRMEELRIQGKSDMDRLYEQQKWMLGGIGTVLLAVAAGAISIILRSLPKGDKESV